MDPHGEYWRRAERNRERGRASERGTHCERWRQMLDSWRYEFRREGGAERYASHRAGWADFVDSRRAHSACPVAVRCCACGAGYCVDLRDRHLCLSFPVCAECDVFVQANPYNPKCRWIVEYFARTLRWGEPEGQDGGDLPFLEMVAEVLAAPDGVPSAAPRPSPNSRRSLASDADEPPPAGAGLHDISGEQPSKHEAFPEEWGW